MSWLAVATARSQVRVGWRTNLEPAYEFDLDAIAEAARMIGLEWDIAVGCAEYPRGRWAGMHSCERAGAGWSHKVRVGRRLAPTSASRVLWHELAHGMQNERDGVERHRAIRLAERERFSKCDYELRPTEREARTYERNAGLHPLVWPV